MKFDKILQYQKIDQELMNLESEVAKATNAKNLPLRNRIWKARRK